MEKLDINNLDINNIEKNNIKTEESAASIERERKFLVKKIPDNLNQFEKEDIEQGYITEPEDKTEVRVRKVSKGNNIKWYQTIKTGEGEERCEIEFEISEEQFKAIWESLTKGKRISKTRYKIPCNTTKGKKLFIELDIFNGDLEGHVTAEVEGEKDDLNELDLPEWIGKDVTEYSNIYGNKALASNSNGFYKHEKLNTSNEKENLGIPEFGVEEGINELLKLTREKMSKKNGVTIVEVAGGSASGKTSIVSAKLLEELGDDALILSMDNYYKGGKYIKDEAEKGNIINFDQPEAINLELLYEHIEQLKRGEPIDKLEFHFSDDPPEVIGKIEPKKVIIIEGLFAINDVLKDNGDVKAFVDIGTHGRILRRILRDIKRTGQKPKDILKYFSDIVEPMQKKYIDSTKKNADLIINNEYKPEIEASKSKNYEIQMKFKTKIDQEKLMRIRGMRRIGISKQIDKYYNPKDRDLDKTGESLRIREEGPYITLTYKGPKLESEFRKKPKLEFEIDKDTENSFLSIYGNRKKTIIKKRTVYLIDDILINVDEVSKEENDKTEKLGSFIEFNFAEKKENNKESFNKILGMLNLDINNAIKESYVEM